MANPKISLDIARLAQSAPTAIPRLIQEMVSKGITPPSWLGYLSMAAGLFGSAITTGDDAPNMPFNVGPEGSGLSEYWRTHNDWTDEAVFRASEATISQDVPAEFQNTADEVARLIKYTASAITGGTPPSRAQYRLAVDAILREANTSGIRRYGDVLMFTLKLHARS